MEFKRWEQNAMLGLLIGDAVGVPYEFNQYRPKIEDLSMQPEESYPRSHPNIEPGTWSDDGAQTLCLLESLVVSDGLSLPDLGKRLLKWLDDGYLTPDGETYGSGSGTRKSLKNIREGVPAYQAGQDGEDSNGNGSLMRVLGLVVWALHRNKDPDDEALVKLAMQQSTVTHAHPISQICCALMALWGKYVTKCLGIPATFKVSYGMAKEKLMDILSKDNVEIATSHIFPERFFPTTSNLPYCTGYVVDTLHCVRYVLDTEDLSFDNVIKRCISIGGDVDTMCAISGGLVMFKSDSISEELVSGLKGKDVMLSVLEHLSWENKPKSPLKI